MTEFWLCFVPLFVAVDAVGVLPLFVTLTEGVDSTRRKRIIVQSVITASVVALVFLLCGPLLLHFLGITVADFMIAGGLLLLTLSLRDLLVGKATHDASDPENLGAVPIGVPLITGPAVLTTCLLLSGMHGRLLTGTAALINILLAGVILWFSQVITGFLGKPGTRIVSKIASLLLASIAVMLIRKGVAGVIPLLK